MDICRGRTILFVFIFLSLHHVTIFCQSINECCTQKSLTAGNIQPLERQKIISQQATLACNRFPGSTAPVSKQNIEIISNGGNDRFAAGTDSSCIQTSSQLKNSVANIQAMERLQVIPHQGTFNRFPGSTTPVSKQNIEIISNGGNDRFAAGTDSSCIQTSSQLKNSVANIQAMERLQVTPHQGTFNRFPGSTTPVSKQNIEIISNGGNDRIGEGIDSSCIQTSPQLINSVANIQAMERLQVIPHKGTFNRFPVSTRPVSKQNVEIIKNGNSGQIAEGIDSTPSVLRQRIFPINANQIGKTETPSETGCQQCQIGNPCDCKICNSEPDREKSSCSRCFSPSVAQQNIINTFPQFNNVNQQGLIGSGGSCNCQNSADIHSPEICTATPNCQKTLVQRLMVRYPNSVDQCENCQQGINPLLARYPVIPAQQTEYCDYLPNTQQPQSCEYPATFRQYISDNNRCSIPIIVTQQPNINSFSSGTCTETSCLTSPTVSQGDASVQSPCAEIENITPCEENLVPNNIDDVSIPGADSSCRSELPSFAGDIPVQLVIMPEVKIPKPSIKVPEFRGVAAPKVPSFAGYPSPPIIVEGSRKSGNFKKWLPLLLVALLDGDLDGGRNGGGGRNCCCRQYVPTPYPVPMPTCNPIVIGENKCGTK